MFSAYFFLFSCIVWFLYESKPLTIILVFGKSLYLCLRLTAGNKYFFYLSCGMFRPCSRFVLTLLVQILICYDRARIFRLCTTVIRYISTVLAVYFELVLDPKPCVNYSFFLSNTDMCSALKVEALSEHFNPRAALVTSSILIRLYFNRGNAGTTAGIGIVGTPKPPIVVL